MTKIVLISCAGKKQKNKVQAKDLYISNLFIKNLAFAESLHPNKIFILSEKHQLLPLTKKKGDERPVWVRIIENGAEFGTFESEVLIL